MKKYSYLGFLLVVVLVTLLLLPLSAYASDDLNVSSLYPYSISGDEYNPDERMAHNFYLDPDLSGTSGEFSAFSIDFKADFDPVYTYWSLCNWDMKGGAGAYAGLQNTEDGKKGIISFWENGSINAKRIYPNDYSHEFGGEGEGTNSIVDYDWKAGKWYRMVIRCYDSATYGGNTIVEQWVQDKESGVWTLLSAFDTKLKNSCMTGLMSAFMENYWYPSCASVRTIQLKNIYVMEYGSTNWKSITGANISIDYFWDNKKGGFSFGATNDWFWGITCGVGEDVINTGNYSKKSMYASINITDGAPQYSFVWPNQQTAKGVIDDGIYKIKTRLDTNFVACSGGVKSKT